MKTKSIQCFSLTIMTVVFASISQAGPCSQKAVKVARQKSHQESILQEVERIKTSKTYLESYGVTFINADGDPGSVTSIVVTMMKNGCAAISVTPR